MEVKYVRHQDIDKQRWDQLVRQTRGGTLYCRSWYLDAVCPDWEALVNEDYTVGMPLTVRKKFGISYLYQPLLSQQLGVLSREPLKPYQVDAVIAAIPASFRLVEITLNDSNPPGKKFRVEKHTTCRLSLNRQYQQIQEKYTENTRRNLKKVTENMRFRTNITAEEFLELLGQDKSAGAAILNAAKNRPALQRLIPAMLNHNSGMICGIKNRTGQLLAAALMGQDKYFHYYLAPAMNEEGREARAMFYLVDRYIHLNAGLQATLDFEGSDIETVARFYTGFGAVPSTYSSLRINRLPWPLKGWADKKVK